MTHFPHLSRAWIREGKISQNHLVDMKRLVKKPEIIYKMLWYVRLRVLPAPHELRQACSGWDDEFQRQILPLKFSAFVINRRECWGRLKSLVGFDNVAAWSAWWSDCFRIRLNSLVWNRLKSVFPFHSFSVAVISSFAFHFYHNHRSSFCSLTRLAIRLHDLKFKCLAPHPSLLFHFASWLNS